MKKQHTSSRARALLEEALGLLDANPVGSQHTYADYQRFCVLEREWRRKVRHHLDAHRPSTRSEAPQDHRERERERVPRHGDLLREAQLLSAIGERLSAPDEQIIFAEECFPAFRLIVLRTTQPLPQQMPVTGEIHRCYFVSVRGRNDIHLHPVEEQTTAQWSVQFGVRPSAPERED